MSCIPATSDSSDCSFGSVRHCVQTARGPFTAPALQKLPPELCVQNLIQHAKSVCRSPDCLPNTLNLSSDITLSGVVSFFKICFHTYAGVHQQHTSSHIKQRRQTDARKSRKLRKIDPRRYDQLFRKSTHNGRGVRKVST